MPGPSPQQRKHGRTPNAADDWREVPDVAFDRAPPMPKAPGRGKWHPLVQAWWTTTSTMPHCVLWRPEDWQKVFELLVEKQRYYRTADEDKKTAQLTEIRRQEDALGIGDAARQRLRIRYVQKTEPGLAGDGPDGAVEVLEDDAPKPAAVAAGVIPIRERRKSILRHQGAGKSGAGSETA